MKKRLLLGLMATSMAMTGFALGQGEYVYTPQGRFVITGSNQNANNSFASFDGWTAVSAAGNAIDANFVINTDGYAAGLNSVQSQNATSGEGMYYKFSPAVGGTYVVSYKMKGGATSSTRIKTTILSTDLVKVEGNTDDVYGGASDVAIANTAEGLSEEWQTFNYAIVGDGTPRTYFISFTGMSTNIEIADLQIAEAQQVADLRQRDAMIEKLEAYKNVYNWSSSVLDDTGITEQLENLEGIDDETLQGDLDDLLEGAEDALTALKEQMEDYLAENDANYLGIRTASGNLQKQDYLGDWLCFPGGRGFWSNSAYPDLGHYAGSSTWAYSETEAPMGVSMEKELSAGSYVFAIEANAAVRENTSSSTWDNNDGLKVAYGVAYVKAVDGDTLLSVVKELLPVNYTQFLVPVQVAAAGTYEIGFKAYCKDEYKSLRNGSVVYVRNAAFDSKNDNKYTQKQLAYEADVREQITTGRTQITTANGYLADASMPWGKAALQEAVNIAEPKVATYESWSQDYIISTYPDNYVKSTSDEAGGLVYTVYQETVKDIIAANRNFVNANAYLTSLQAAIDAANDVMTQRVYDAATGKADLQAAVANAESLLAQMKATDYSEENAEAITAEINALNTAVETFKTTVPASAVTTIVDIDFEQTATVNSSTGLYTIAGNKGSMEFTAFSTSDSPVDGVFEQGLWSNGEQLYKGYLRVGNGEGTVEFDPTENGSMGTNILKVTFDFYLQGLSDRYVGVFLKNETATEDVAAFYANYYNNLVQDPNTFGIDLANLQYGSGSSYDNAAPEGAEPATSTVQSKNSFEFIFDFGEKSMYCTTTSAKGVVKTDKKSFDGTIPYSFMVKCNYGTQFGSRRPWFDNLKIERITAGESTGIKEVNTAEQTVVPVKKVIKDGRIVINGKYGLNGIVIK